MNPFVVALVTGAFATRSHLQAFTPSLCRPFLTNRCGVPSVSGALTHDKQGQHWDRKHKYAERGGTADVRKSVLDHRVTAC